MDLQTAIKTIRKELLIKDQPLKAYNLLKAVNISELKPELDRTYAMVKHYFEDDAHTKAYDIPVPDAGAIEPEEVCLNPSMRYKRYAWVVEEAKNEKPKSMIDLGCYVGSLPIYFASKGLKSTGVDLTTGSLVIARQRADKFNVKVDFIHGDITKFNKGKYDMVISFETFEHVNNPPAFLKSLANLTTENGWVYITTPNGPFGNGKGNIEMKGGWDAEGPRGHLYAFNLTIMKELLKDYQIGRLSEEDDNLLWIKYRKKV